jgi:hypothetical protein
MPQARSTMRPRRTMRWVGWPAYNAVRDPDLLADVGWVPSAHLAIDPTLRVPSLIESEAGPLNW